VRNSDRTLTEAGGNPNLLWNTETERLAVIDHNLAFSDDFSPSEFAATHVFSSQLRNVFSDWVRRGEWQQLLTKALPAWEAAWESAPEEWWFLDDSSLATDFDVAAIRALLSACERDDFWDLRQ
jgi:hypothetical protein